jgi:glucosyl-3-phosphoglycerate synthase
MAQVDIGTRQNRHQPLADLSRMSSVVLRTVAAREGISARYLEAEGGDLWDAHQPETYLHAVATEHGLRLDEYLNELVERPPMARLTGDTAVPVGA